MQISSDKTLVIPFYYPIFRPCLLRSYFCYLSFFIFSFHFWVSCWSFHPWQECRATSLFRTIIETSWGWAVFSSTQIKVKQEVKGPLPSLHAHPRTWTFLSTYRLKCTPRVRLPHSNLNSTLLPTCRRGFSEQFGSLLQILQWTIRPLTSKDLVVWQSTGRTQSTGTLPISSPAQCPNTI